MSKAKLIALIIVFISAGGIVGTGAFNTVEAERTADVAVDGDANALLGIEPIPDPGSSSFITTDGTSDSEFNINVAGQDGSEGLNSNGSTTGEKLFNITNNGQQAITVQLYAEGGLANNGSEVGDSNDNYEERVNVHFYVDNDELESSGGDTLNNASVSRFDTFIDDTDYVISEEGTRSNTINSSRSVSLQPGESVPVSVYTEIDVGINNIDNSAQVIDTIGIVAVAGEQSDNEAGT